MIARSVGCGGAPWPRCFWRLRRRRRLRRCEISWGAYGRLGQWSVDFRNAAAAAPRQEAEAAPRTLDGIVQAASGPVVVTLGAVAAGVRGQQDGFAARTAGACGVEGDVFSGGEVSDGHDFLHRLPR